MTDELTKPELGYVKIPFDVEKLEDFTFAQISHAAEEPGGFSTAIVFSTKDEPNSLPFRMNSSAVEEKYFGLHHDLSAAAIAQQLGGDLVWQRSDELEWAAVLRFHRAVEAMR